MNGLKSVRAGQNCTVACLRGDFARSYRYAPQLLAMAVSCVLMGYQTEAYAVAPVAQNPVKGTLILYEDQYAGLNSNNTLVIDTGASVELNGQRLSAGYSNDSNSLVRNNVLNSSGNVTDSYELQGGLYAGSAISDGAKTASIMSAGNTINIILKDIISIGDIVDGVTRYSDFSSSSRKCRCHIRTVILFR